MTDTDFAALTGLFMTALPYMLLIGSTIGAMREIHNYYLSEDD